MLFKQNYYIKIYGYKFSSAFDFSSPKADVNSMEPCQIPWAVVYQNHLNPQGAWFGFHRKTFTSPFTGLRMILHCSPEVLNRLSVQLLLWAMN
jgi:hypothetical protein